VKQRLTAGRSYWRRQEETNQGPQPQANTSVLTAFVMAAQGGLPLRLHIAAMVAVDMAAAAVAAVAAAAAVGTHLTLLIHTLVTQLTVTLPLMPRRLMDAAAMRLLHVIPRQIVMNPLIVEIALHHVEGVCQGIGIHLHPLVPLMAVAIQGSLHITQESVRRAPAHALGKETTLARKFILINAK